MRSVRSDPVKREQLNATRRGNPKYLAKGRAYNLELKTSHFFRWRARLASGSDKNITAQQLAHIWREQHGKCALSGKKLKRDAHLDHIIPKSRGGKTEIINLRWLDPWVNVARQNLNDIDFYTKCIQVAEWLEKQIIAMDRETQ